MCRKHCRQRIGQRARAAGDLPQPAPLRSDCLAPYRAECSARRIWTFRTALKDIKRQGTFQQW